MTRPRILIAGGSLGGLCAALSLRCVNCDVNIFEKSRGSMSSRGAGLVVQRDVIDFLERHGIATREAVSVASHRRQYLDRDGSIKWKDDSLQLMTSWDMLYRQLREVFPDNLYHNSSELARFEQNENQVIAQFKNKDEEKGDLLIGADGRSSTVRQQLLPQVKPEYAGYVAWRGVVQEDRVSAEIAEFFVNKFTFFHGHRTHILCYVIPGDDGEIAKGKRRLNWVWYVNVSKDKIASLLTDKHGMLREFSVPQGLIQEEFVELQKNAAKEILPAIFYKLVQETSNPFVETITDLSVPQMAFGRVCLIGDAAFVVRPHTGASTAKAASNAIALANSIEISKGDVVAALKTWEPREIENGNHLMAYGIKLGSTQLSTT